MGQLKLYGFPLAKYAVFARNLEGTLLIVQPTFHGYILLPKWVEHSSTLGRSDDLVWSNYLKGMYDGWFERGISESRPGERPCAHRGAVHLWCHGLSAGNSVNNHIPYAPHTCRRAYTNIVRV